MFRLRHYQSCDWDNFLLLELETIGARTDANEPSSATEFRKRWPTQLRERYRWTVAGPTTDQSRILVCETCRGEYVGHVWLTEKRDFFSDERVLFINAIAVFRSYRKLGAGKLLMKAAYAEARDRGMGRIELGVDSSNAAALKLYESMGFAVHRLAMRADVAPQ